MRCCAGDGGGPSGIALQGEVPNHRKLRRLRAGVVSVAGRRAHEARWVGAGKASESEPSMTCRNAMSGVETGVHGSLRDERRGHLFTACAAPGMEVARARFRRWHGTWEPVVPIPSAVHWILGSPGREKEIPKRLPPRGAEY